MQVPPQISFHGLQPSPYNERYIRERIARLQRLHDNIISCRVVVERPHQNKLRGNPFRCRVELSLPRKKELVASKEEKLERHARLRTVVGHAFDAMERQLRSVINAPAHRSQQMAPHHELSHPPHGIVVRLFHTDGYGFIKTLDGTEYYMHRNSVLRDKFDELRIGAEVRFEAVEGEEGPRASTVQLVAQPGARATDDPVELAQPPHGWEISRPEWVSEQHL
ncbi:MAG: HPF/RaiA family ribosome-associated protein [Spongiibacteraceae bacterium]|jgi:cold shock CspA family protein/ribosome-associated translation inhibitor RaiA|nr:HPF/RaiA family ribosome-associated protein [Spongiibacteraceae bacterium]